MSVFQILELIEATDGFIIMVKLFINPENAQHIQLEHRLLDYSLQFEKHYSDEKNPVIVEEDKVYRGFDKIEEFFIDLKEFYDAWYEDRCDKYYEGTI